nr:AMP-binding protein [uncultured Pseudomonas sp.]
MNSKPWLATYPQLGIPSDIGPLRHDSVVGLLEEAMRNFRDKPAFHSYGETLHYGDVDRLSSAFAAWLQHKLGVKKGDRIAVMMPNLLAFPIAFLGIARAGAIQVSINPLYTAPELEHQLNDSGCRVIVVFNGSSPTLSAVIDKTQLQTVISVGVSVDDDDRSPPSPQPIGARLSNTIAFDAVLRQGATLQRTPVDIGGDDLLLLQYTGGTTGLSKGAALSHRNLLANTEQFQAMMAGTLCPGEEVLVTALPLYHIFALMVNFITCFSIGTENWLVANPSDMDGFIDILIQARPSLFIGVNTLYAHLVTHPRIGEVDFSRLHLAGGGGAPVLDITSRKWENLTGTFIREGYGLSETAPILSFNPASIREFTSTTGLPVPGTYIKLLNEEGVEVPIGEAGEICAKGPQVMRGYWNKPEANASAFTADGFFLTGDIGKFDALGFLTIVDRKKDMIIVSGFNVFPNEIEAYASSCPGIQECACIGVPNEKTGEAVRLYVVRAAGSSLTAHDVISHCRVGLTGYKIPKSVVFVEELPKSTVGKILRRELRHRK